MRRRLGRSVIFSKLSPRRNGIDTVLVSCHEDADVVSVEPRSAEIVIEDTKMLLDASFVLQE